MGVDYSGALMKDCGVAEVTKDYAKDPGKARKLWELSEELVGQRFEY